MLKNRIILAIDKSNLNEAKELCLEVKDYAGFFKLGMEFFYSFGKEGIREIAKLGVPIFLDLKLHDIPNTVLKSSIALLKDLDGVEMFTLHASGGFNMMHSTNEALKKELTKKPMLLGVTVLTSTGEEAQEKSHFPFALGIIRALTRLKKLKPDFKTEDFMLSRIKSMVQTANGTLHYWINLYPEEERRIQEANLLLQNLGLQLKLDAPSYEFYKHNLLTGGILNEVLHFVNLASKSGLEGIVCSPLETRLAKTFFPELKIITPGIRPNWYNTKDDQSRTVTPKEAIQNGADYLVIGRPITQSHNPKEAIQKTLEELNA